jgi:hypothetical protein
MIRYIDKDAIINKIKEKRDAALMRQHNLEKIGQETIINEQVASILDTVLSFIDTLKVKRVYLEKEFKDFLDNIEGVPHLRHSAEQIKWGKDIAKHFYELGLDARIDKELVEEVYSHLEGIKDTADRMTSGNFMHHRAAIKFSANTIAKVLELMGIKV